MIDSLGWGIILWLIGYVLGIVLFFFVPLAMIGWVIAPIGFLITLWAAVRWVERGNLGYYLLVAVIWTVLAVVLDYFFLVQLFKPADGYYKIDVYLYYTLTFLIPLGVGWWVNRNKDSTNRGQATNR